MTGYTPTEAQPANNLKVGACCVLDGNVYRCIRRASLVTLADVETGTTRDVLGIERVTRAVPSGTPGTILGHVAGAETTAGQLATGVLVLVRTGWRWELARADPSIIHVRGRQARGFKAVTPWQRSPTRFRTPVDATCWLAVPVADVPLKHVRAKPPPVKRVRPSRARPKSEHAPRKPPPAASQIAFARPVAAVAVKAPPIVDVPPPPPPARIVPPTPEGATEWWTLHRTTRRGQQETLLFAERADADAYVRTRRLERVPTRLKGIIRTERTEDGLLRAYLPPPSFQGKPIPPKKARLPYKDDDDRDDD